MMNNRSRLALIFSVLFAVLFISPALLSGQFGPYPLMKVGDVVDLFTPLVLIPIYWRLFQAGRERAPTAGESLVFMVVGACWAAGQGMHLSANSIGHLLKSLPDSDAAALTYTYDEIVSHYLWHFGIVGLSALLLYRQWRNPPAAESSGWLAPGLAGILHGLTYFIIVVEAGTAILGVPFAVLIALAGLVRGRQRLGQQPVLAFFVVAYVVASLLFLGWAVYWGGLPQFSQVGIID